MSSVMPQSHKFTVRDFYRMADAGILGPNDRVELIEGEVVQMNPIGSHHAGTVDRLAGLLFAATVGKAIVRVQNPVRLSDLSEPQPDLTLLKPRDDSYTSSHPTAADILLLVEVSDSSLIFDRTAKLTLYAAAGVAEVWIVDLTQRVLTSYSSPESGKFSRTHQLRPGETIAPILLPEIQLVAGDICGA